MNELTYQEVIETKYMFILVQQLILIFMEKIKKRSKEKNLPFCSKQQSTILPRLNILPTTLTIEFHTYNTIEGMVSTLIMLI